MISRKQTEAILLMAIGALLLWYPQYMGQSRAADQKIIVAAEKLQGGDFDHAVVLLLSHDGHGAQGVILNKPSQESGTAGQGGPVESDKYITLHSLDIEPEGSAKLEKLQIAYTEGKIFAESILNGKEKPAESLVLKGKASWGKGQLDKEIERGDWTVVPFSSDIAFHTDSGKMWEKASAAVIPPK